MAETTDQDWREKAKAEGFAVIPEADLKGLQNDSTALKDMRSMVPDEYKGKEKDFFTKAKVVDAAKDTPVETPDALRQFEERFNKFENDLTSLKGENTKLKNENNSLKSSIDNDKKSQDIHTMLRERNVKVHPRFMTDELFGAVDRSKYDMTSEAGRKEYAKDLYEKTIAPAIQEQQTFLKDFAGIDDGETSTERKSDEKAKDTMTQKEKMATERMRKFGSLA